MMNDSVALAMPDEGGVLDEPFKYCMSLSQFQQVYSAQLPST